MSTLPAPLLQPESDAPTGLLVSVRDADEARAALAGGASVIDVKEPRRGALGCAGAATVASVVEAIGGQAPVTAAAGELADGFAEARRELAGCDGVAACKVGLAGMARMPWRRRLRQFAESLAPGVELVAAAYGDHDAARAPSPREVLDFAADNGARWLLVDTWSKSRGDLFGYVSPDSLNGLREAARRRGVAMVVAGGLTGEALTAAAALLPALVGVRGATCRGGREQTIDAALVEDSVRRIKLAGAGAARHDSHNAHSRSEADPSSPQATPCRSSISTSPTRSAARRL